MSKCVLLKSHTRVAICISGKDRGIERVASNVAADIKTLVSADRKAEVRVVPDLTVNNFATTNTSTVIYAGIAEEMGETLEGRERFRVSYEELPNKISVRIVGSDKLGVIYGLYYISTICGVSPWHYFADVKVLPKDEVIVDSMALSYESNEPKIKLRGFFLNDEWPSLGNWVHSTFGGFNELFYEHVFDLLLRLRGNFLWPAMWTGIFSDDGKAYPTAIAELADELGITMGTSHHEPLFRAGEEFTYLMSDSNDEGYGKDWSFYTNERGLTAFWDDSVKRNKNFNSLITIGMRGERDSKILGEDATMQDNIDLLKKTILAQKQILRDNGLADAPKVLALYKEVEDYFYGDAEAEGLIEWDELDDTMLLLSDDNFANLRTLPNEKLFNRKAGFGIYYHFDYHGDPISYEWVNSTPITKAWEQLTTAYDNGIRDLWIVNVGDLRPQELPLSYFMALADDYDYWSEPNKTEEFLLGWTKQQFGEFVPSDSITGISSVLNGYTRLNGDIRPEATHPDTLSFVEGNESVKEIARCDALDNSLLDVKSTVSSDALDSFYGLVEFPTLGSTNLRRMMIYKGMYDVIDSYGASYANVLVDKINETIANDIELVRKYNEDMSEGKWRHMMSSKHVDFKHWNDEDSSYPDVSKKEYCSEGKLLVCVNRGTPNSTNELPVFTNLEKQSVDIWVMTTGTNAIDLSVSSSMEVITSVKDLDNTCKVINVSIDWPKVNSSGKFELTISALGEVQTLEVLVNVFDISDIDEGVFVESCEVVSIPSDNYVDADEAYLRIDNYGKTGVSMKAYPLRASYEVCNAPSMTYKIFINNEGEYVINCRIAPTNNPFKNAGLKLAVSIDGNVSVIDTLPEGYMAGYVSDPVWAKGVLINERKITKTANLSKGLHEIKFLTIDSGVVLQKIEISKTLSSNFYGFDSTFRK